MVPLTRRAHRVLSLAMLSVVFLAFTVQASASSVGCSGASAGPYDFNSLQAALAAANPNGDVIYVSGVCTELVGVYSFNNLTINGTPGATLVEPSGTNSQGDVLDIYNSQGLSINNLRIQANPHTAETYIVVVGITGSSVTFRNVTLEGAAMTDGFNIYPASNVTFQGGVIENNPDGYGMYITGSGSTFTLQRGPGGTCPVIQNNVEGLYADTNASVIVRHCATIQNNSDVGITGTNGGSVDVRNAQDSPGAIQVKNNYIGIFVATGGNLFAAGPMLIQGNSLEGIRVRSARASILASGAGPLGPNVTQNGFGTSMINAVVAGVAITNGATVDISGATIKGNSAPGVHITDNASVRLIGNGQLQITGNQAGVVLQYSSVALLAYGPVISGNGTDLTCSDSQAYGDASAVGRINCPGFKSQTNPGLGSQHKGKIIP